MPSEHRLVRIAIGHTVKVRRSREPTSRTGFVRVQTSSHRPPFDIAERLWTEGTRA